MVGIELLKAITRKVGLVSEEGRGRMEEVHGIVVIIGGGISGLATALALHS